MSSLRPKWTRTLSILLTVTMVFASSPMQALAQTERPDSDTVELQVSTAEILATMDKWQEASSDPQDSSVDVYEEDGEDDGYEYGSEEYVRNFLAEMLPSNVGTQIAESVEEILATEAVEETVEVTKDPPEMVIQGEDGDRTETLDDESVQETFTVDKAIADLIDSLVLPFEEEDSVIMRTQLLAELEGKWLVKFFDSDDLGKRNVQALVVLDTETLDLDAFLINTSSRDITFSLTVVDEQGNLVELSDLSAILLAASREELTEEELERYRGTDGVEVEILGVTATEGEADEEEEEEEEEEETGNTGSPSGEEQEEEEPDPSEEENEGDGEEQPGEPDDENPGLDEGGDVSDSGDSSEGEETASDPGEEDDQDSGSDVGETSSDDADSGDSESSGSADQSESNDSASSDSGSSDSRDSGDSGSSDSGSGGSGDSGDSGSSDSDSGGSGDSGDSGSSDSGSSDSGDSDSGERYYTDIGRTLLALNAGDSLSDDNGSDDSSDSGSDDSSSGRSDARIDSGDDDSSDPADDSDDDESDLDDDESDKPATGENGEGDGQIDDDGNDEDDNSSTGAGNGDGEEDSTGAGNSGEEEEKDDESESESEVEIESIDAIVVQGSVADTEDEVEKVELTVGANSFAILSFGLQITAADINVGEKYIAAELSGTKYSSEKGSGIWAIDLTVEGRPEFWLKPTQEYHPANVVIVLDMSTSMTSNTLRKADNTTVTRWKAARDIAYELVEALLLDENGNNNTLNQVAVVGYGSGASISAGTSAAGVLVPFSKAIDDFDYGLKELPLNLSNISTSQGNTPDNNARYRADPVVYGGSTNAEAGFIEANRVLSSVSDNGNANFVVFLSDGAANYRYTDPAPTVDGYFNELSGTSGTNANINTGSNFTAAINAANAIDAFVYTIGIGLSDSNNTQTAAGMMKACATSSEFYYPSSNYAALETNFSNIGIEINKSQLVIEDHKEMVITDPLSKYVELVEGSIQLWTVDNDGSESAYEGKVDDEVTISQDADGNQIITWEVGNFNYTKKFRMRYDVRVREEYRGAAAEHKEQTSGKTPERGNDGLVANGYTWVTSELMDYDEIEILVPTVDWDGTKTGTKQFQVFKQDESGALMSTKIATFGLYEKDANGNYILVGEEKTSAGIATFTSEKYASANGERILILREIDFSDDDYRVRSGDIAQVKFYNGEYIDVTIISTEEGVYYTGSGNSLGLAVKNYLKGGSIVVKKYETGESIGLAGAVFRLYNENGSSAFSYTATTNTNGVATFNDIPPGKYMVVETTAPTGYSLSGQSYVVEVKAGEAVTESLIFYNDAKFTDTDLIIRKYGQDNQTPLNGVVFELEHEDGEKIILTTSNGSDFHTFTETQQGEWTLTETQVGSENSDYTLLGKIATINVSRFGSYTVTIEPSVANMVTFDSSSLALRVVNKLAYLNNNEVTIKKVVPQGILDSNDDEFEFVINGTGANSGFSTKVSVTANDATGVPIEGLMANYVYTITETPKVGYKLNGITGDSKVSGSGNSYSFTAPAVNGSLVLQAENVWDTTTGGGNALVTVKKQVEGGVPIKASDSFTINFIPVTGIGSIRTATLQHNQQEAVEGLIVGQTYRIEEEPITGYVVGSVLVGSEEIQKNNGQYLFKVPSDNVPVVVTVVNKIDESTETNSKVTLTKSLQGDLLSDSHEFTFTFSSTTGEVKDVTITIKAGQTKPVGGLIAGFEYTVTEQNIPTGYRFTGFNEHSTFTAPTSDGIDIDIIAYNETDYISTESNVQAQKQMKSDQIFLSDETFKITLVDEFNNTPIVVDLNGPAGQSAGSLVNVADFANNIRLVNGIKYTVTETLIPDGYKLVDINGESAYTFTAGTPLTLVVTNEIDYLEGGNDKVKVTLTKTFEDGVIAASDEFIFDIYRLGETNNSLNKFPVTLKQSNRYTFDITNLIAGQQYVIEEKVPSGYVLNNISGNGIALDPHGANAYLFTAPTRSSTNGMKLVAQNRREHLGVAAEVTLEKVIDGGAGIFLDEAKDEFVFELVHPDGTQPSEITLSKSNGFKVDLTTLAGIPDLIVGRKYTIREVDVPVGYTMGSINNESAVTGYTFVLSSADAKLELVADNSYDILADTTVQLQKLMEDDEPFLQDDKLFEFIITNTNSEIDNTIKVSASVNDGFVNIEGLIAGQTYTIIESEKTNYVFERFVGDIVTYAGGVWTIKAPVNNSTTYEITAYNSIVKSSDSKVTIRKVLEAEKLHNAQDEFVFQVFNQNGTPAGDPFIVSAGKTSPESITGLMVGQTYILKEIGVTRDHDINNAITMDVAGYKLSKVVSATDTSVVNAWEFKVPAGDATIELVAHNVWNIPDPDGSKELTKLTKLIDETDLINDTDKFVFYIDGPNVDNNVQHILQANETLSVSGLVAGQTYTLTEETVSYKLSGVTAIYTLNSVSEEQLLSPNADGSYSFAAPPDDGTTLQLAATNVRKTVGTNDNTTVTIEKKMMDKDGDGNDIQYLDAGDLFDFNFNYGLAVHDAVTDIGFDQSAPVNNIVIGVPYTIHESPQEPGYKIDHYEIAINGKEAITNTDGSFTVNEGDTIVITAYNTLDYNGSEENDGKIGIKKALVGDKDLLNPLDTEFFVRAYPKGTNIQTNPNDFVEEITMQIGEYSYFKNLVLGQSYILAEEDKTGYKPIEFIAEKGSITAGGEFTVSADRTQEYRFTLVNDYDYASEQNITVSIVKQLEKQTDQLINPTDTFKVEAVDEYGNVHDTLHLKVEEPQTFDNLVVGLQYTLRETMPDNAYELAGFAGANPQGEFTLAENDNPQIEKKVNLAVINTVKTIGIGDGKISIVKQLQDKENDYLVHPDDKFYVAAVDEYGNDWEILELELGTPAFFSTLVPTKSYSLREIFYTDSTNTTEVSDPKERGYVIVGFTKADGTVFKAGDTFIAGGEEDIAFTITNTLNRVETGEDNSQITLVKTLVDSQNFLHPDTDEFTITATDQYGYIVETVYVKGGQTVVFEKLLKGRTYFLQEPESGMPDGYLRVAIQGDGVLDNNDGTYTITTPQNGTGKIALTVVNDLDKIGENGNTKVSVVKAMDGIQGYLDDDDEFIIVAYDIYGNEVDRVTTDTLGNPGSFTKLVKTQTYELREIAPIGYRLVKFDGTGVNFADGKYTFTVTDGETINITAVNERDDLGSGSNVVTIKKVMTNGEFYSTGDEFYVTAYDKDGDEIETVPVGADGVAKGFEKLINGQTYTLVETILSGGNQVEGTPKFYRFVEFRGSGINFNSTAQRYEFTVDVDTSNKTTQVELEMVNTRDYIDGEDGNGKVEVTKVIDNGNALHPDKHLFTISAYEGSTRIETQTVKAGETVQFKQLVYGKTYRLEEENILTGYQFVSFEGTNGTSIQPNGTQLTIDDANRTATYSITLHNRLNNAVENGLSVTVVKELENSNKTINPGDQFQVRFVDEFDNVYGPYPLDLDVPHTLDELVEGVTYTIQEPAELLPDTAYQFVGFEGVDADNKFVIDNQNVQLKVINKLDTGGTGNEKIGKISVMKRLLTDDDYLVNPSDKFYVAAIDENGQEWEVLTLSLGEVKSFETLVNGKTYTLKEIQLNENEYRFVRFLENGVNVGQTATFTYGGEKDIAFTVFNTLNYVDTAVGDEQVTLVKTLTGTQQFNDPSNDVFTITATDIHDRLIETVTVKPGESAHFKLLVKGKTYTLEERIELDGKKVMPDGYLHVAIQGNGVTDNGDGTYDIAIVGDNKIELNVVNELDYVDPGTGTGDEQVNIVKVMKDGGFLDPSDTFQVTAYDKFGNAVETVTIGTDGQAQPFALLVKGQTYTLAEADVDGYKLVEFQVVNGGSATVSNSFTVNGNNRIRITVVNTLDYVDGGGEGKDAQITLTKEMAAGDYFLHPAKDEFEVTAYDKFLNPVETVEVKAGETAGFSKLVKSQTYTLVETGMPNTGYIFQEFKVNGSVTDTFTVVGDGKIALTAVNRLDYMDANQIQITKELEEEQVLDASHRFTFTAYDVYGAAIDSVTIPVDNTGSFTKLVKGETYTLAETMDDAYKLVSFTVNGADIGNTFTVNGSDTIEILATNALKKADISVIDITKLINDSITGGAELLREEFTVNLLRDGNIVATGIIDSVTGAFAWNAGSPTELFPATYTLEEVLETPTNFEKGPMLINGVETNSFEIVWNTQMVEVEINNYSRLTNGVDDRVTITKLMANENTRQPDYDPTFTIYLSGDGERHTIRLRADGTSQPITGLKYGATYTVTEGTVGGYALYGITINGVAVDGNRFTITDANTEFEIVVTNMYVGPERKDRDEYEDEIDEGVMSALSGYTEIGDDDIPLSDLTDIEDGQIPQAGGFAMETVGLAGIMVLILGIFLKRRRKDSAESGE